MRNGFYVYDTDTHVMPAAEVLEQYVDPDFRARMSEFSAYRVPVDAPTDGAAPWHQYRIKRRFYRRVLGDAEPHPTFTGHSGRWRGSKQPRPGVQDDRAGNRVKDVDDEGSDVHFLVPSSRTGSIGLEDPAFEVGFTRAYHRHMADFCGQYPDRLKSMIVASTRCVEDAVREIHRWGTSKWAVAVMLLQNLPVDHPNLEPIWKAAQDYDLAVVHHSSTWNPSYFPGYQDLRVGILECGFGWLPFWARRMDEQATYGGGVAPLKHAPSDYLTSGRFFCSIEMHEGEDRFNSVTAFLGDAVLMYASDYPHPECHFPDSVEQVLSWPSLKPDTQRKLLWDNAVRFYKQT